MANYDRGRGRLGDPEHDDNFNDRYDDHYDDRDRYPDDRDRYGGDHYGDRGDRGGDRGRGSMAGGYGRPPTGQNARRMDRGFAGTQYPVDRRDEPGFEDDYGGHRSGPRRRTGTTQGGRLLSGRNLSRTGYRRGAADPRDAE